MNTYKIKSLETGATLAEIQAHKIVVDGDNGIVRFVEDGYTPRLLGTTQLSASILIYEERPPKPALVTEFPKDTCTIQSSSAKQ